MIDSFLVGKIYVATDDYFASKSPSCPILIKQSNSFKVIGFSDGEWILVQPLQEYSVCGIPQTEIKIDWNLFLDYSTFEGDYSYENNRNGWRRNKEYAN